MKEDFILYLWRHQLLDKYLQTTDGDELAIIKTGQVNQDSGPDIFNSMIKIGNEIWAGNIEVHIFSSDWFKHGHENDNAYDNIILHLVYENDITIRRKNGEIIPCLQIKDKFSIDIQNKYLDFIENQTWISCENQITEINIFDLHNWFDRLAGERLQIKADNLMDNLASNKYDFQDLFYINISRSFGFKTNSMAFELLAKSTPLKILLKHKNNLLQIEALLFGQAGFLNDTFIDEYPIILSKEYLFLSHKYKLKPLDKKIWKFMRTRPSNFPSIRISQLAAFINNSDALLLKIFESNSLSTIKELLTVSASDYWKYNFRFDKPRKTITSSKLGYSSINLLMINTIIPFMFSYGKFINNETMMEKSLKWLEEIKPEQNIITRNFSKHKIKAVNSWQSQALIQLYEKYCLEKKCLDCRIGHKLITGL